MPAAAIMRHNPVGQGEGASARLASPPSFGVEGFARLPGRVSRFKSPVRLPLILGLLPVLAACSEGAQGKDFQDLVAAPRVERTQPVSLVQPLGGANVVALNGAVPATAGPGPAPLAAAPVGNLEGPDRLARL